MSTIKRRLAKQEFARRGDKIHKNAVRPRLLPGDDGKFVAIDIDTSEFEIDADELTAGDRLRERLPEAQIWMVRVGSRYVHRFGGRDRQEKYMRRPTCDLSPAHFHATFAWASRRGSR